MTILTGIEQEILSQQILNEGCKLCVHGYLPKSGEYICKVGAKHPACLKKGGKFELIDD